MSENRVPVHEVRWGAGKPPEKMGERPPVKIEKRGFESKEIVEIEGKDLRDASEKFGKLQGDAARQVLDRRFGDLPIEKKAQLFENARLNLDRMEDLIDRGIFKVDGVDYLQRYNDAFKGYCRGAGLEPEEGAVLQAEIMPGCQSMIVQDRKTGETGFIHTEEDLDNAERMAQGEYGYRSVRMKAGDKTVDFFAYPGLAGWGPAYGVNETTGMMQMVDDLVVKDDVGLGDIWANAMAFMTLDAGDTKIVEKMVSQIKNADPPVAFTGGYAIHMIDKGEIPRIMSVEFAGESMDTVLPDVVDGKNIIAQGNASRTDAIAPLTAFHPPAAGENWDTNNAVYTEEMVRRTSRMRLWGKHEKDLVGGDPKKTVAAGLKILALPFGDIEEIIEDDGTKAKDVTGLPTKLVASHVAGYMGKEGMSVVMGKKNPPPILGMEYSLSVDGNEHARASLEKIAGRRTREHAEGTLDQSRYASRGN